MDLIQFQSFSSAWFWFSMIGIWALFCQLYLGVSYHQMCLARKRFPERQPVLLNVIALYLERMTWSMSENINPFKAGVCGFVVSFWIVCAFYYDQEVMQAFFFLFVPLGPSLILRWRLAQSLVNQPEDFETVFRRIRTIRYWTFLSSFVTILTSTFWGIHIMLSDYTEL